MDVIGGYRLALSAMREEKKQEFSLVDTAT